MAELNITKENFELEVMQADKPVLIDFWAVWCGPCKMLSPIIAELAEDYAGRVKVCKVNVDEQPELAAAFAVASIPMVVLMDKGHAVDASIGYCPKQQLADMIDKHL